MPRRRQFDPEQTLDRVMELFWERGYECTSIQEIVEVTGVNRASLYDTFGDKHALFLAAIRRYGDTVVGEMCRVLNGAETPLEGVETALRLLAEPGGSDCRGCMLTNTIVEFAGRDPELGDLIRSMLTRLEGAYELALIRARERGEIDPDTDPAIVARHLLNASQGLMVLGKVGLGRETVDSVLRITLSAAGIGGQFDDPRAQQRQVSR